MRWEWPLISTDSELNPVIKLAPGIVSAPPKSCDELF